MSLKGIYSSKTFKNHPTAFFTQKERRFILKFNSENLKALHFFTEGLNYPITVAAYSDWQEVQISYLESVFRDGKFTSEKS